MKEGWDFRGRSIAITGASSGLGAPAAFFSSKSHTEIGGFESRGSDPVGRA